MRFSVSHIVPARIALASLTFLVLLNGALARAEPYACPEEFDQTYEWDDRGFTVNGSRAILLADGIANDPGPDALHQGKQRVIISGDDQVVMQEVQGWIIELDQDAMIAGQRPYSRARTFWRRSYEAAIGDKRYRAEESSEKPPVRETKPRRPGQSLEVKSLGMPGPAEMNLTLAPEGTPGFSRGPNLTVTGFRCITQIFAPMSGDTGPRVEACIIDLPASCKKRRLIKPLTLESSVSESGKKTIVRKARTTALRIGSRGFVVAPQLIAPPPQSLEPIGAPDADAQPPGALLCDCRQPERNCTPAQQAVCASKERR